MLITLNENEINEILKRNIIGRLGCHDEHSSYIVPVSYVYENGAVLCHSFEGHKINLMRANPVVCFEIDEIRDFSNWTCIIANGTYVELTSASEIAHARTFFSEEMLDMKISETALPLNHTRKAAP